MCPSWCRSCAANTVAAPAISPTTCVCSGIRAIPWRPSGGTSGPTATGCVRRSEEHTSELQSRSDLVCRLLLEKKKKTNKHSSTIHRRNPQLHTLIALYSVVPMHTPVVSIYAPQPALVPDGVPKSRPSHPPSYP